jgi:hypothetical protein
MKVLPHFTKVYNSGMQSVVFKTRGETLRFLMYVVSSGLVRYGENTFMLNKFVRQKIVLEMGLKKGSVYRHLRKLKELGVIEMLGMGNYLINKSIVEYGQSKEDWKQNNSYLGNTGESRAGKKDSCEGS